MCLEFLELSSRAPTKNTSLRFDFDMDVSKNRGTPKWMVKIMENPTKMDDLGGNTPIFGNTHMAMVQMIRPPKINLPILNMINFMNPFGALIKLPNIFCRRHVRESKKSNRAGS